MTSSNVGEQSRRVPAWKWGVRIAIIAVAAVLFGRALHTVKAELDHATAQAGFVRGAFDGVVMPMTMPYLLCGGDTPIYADNNVGRLYKLGYTLGVNGCGAVFFGVLFQRVQRWRRLANRPESDRL